MKKIYYGWILLPFASLGVIMSIPGQTAGVSAFTEPLLSLSGISRTALSSAYLLGTLSSGFILPFIGKIVDRLGSRIMMVVASLCMGATLLGLSQIDHITDRFSEIFPAIDSKLLFFIALILGFFCLRFFGQGLFPLVSNTMVGKWFEKYRGRAVAIMGSANSLALAAAPAVMNQLVVQFGWSLAWIILAGLLGLGMSLVALLFYRKNPESCGLHVDGIKPLSSDENPQNLEKEISGFTLKEARGTWAFWLLGLALAIHAAIITGFTFHIQAIGIQTNMVVEKALAIFIPVSFIAMPLSFGASWASRRIPWKWYLRVICIGEALAYFSLYYLNTSFGYVFAIIGMGIVSGLMGPIMSTIIPQIFGRKHLGAINGAVSSMLVIGSALGPLFLSLVRDITGYFPFAILLATIMPLLILVISLLLSKKIQEIS